MTYTKLSPKNNFVCIGTEEILYWKVVKLETKQNFNKSQRVKLRDKKCQLDFGANAGDELSSNVNKKIGFAQNASKMKYVTWKYLGVVYFCEQTNFNWTKKYFIFFKLI